MKIAIVHDYLHQAGGAERVVAVLHEMFPQAPIYTSIFNPANFPDKFKKMDIRVSFMQRLPFVFNNFRMFFLLYPFAFQSFDLKEYDLIISSSSAFAKGVRKRSDAAHVCYCHNPMRFVWQYDEYIKKEGFHPLIKSVLPLLLAPLKYWDRETAKNVDYFIANSEAVSSRIKSLYHRDSVIIYPPIDTAKHAIFDRNGDYFLVVSRLAAYKRIDLAVSAFTQLKLPLKIVGEGPVKKELQKIAGSNVEFLGKVSDEELKRMYSACRALILPGVEDFGLTPLEAAACGRPTIAFEAGGALETVINRETGLFFAEQTAEALAKAVLELEKMPFDRDILRQQAEHFDKEVFKQRMRSFLNENKIL